MGPYTSILDQSAPKHQVNPCPTPNGCGYPQGVFPLQPEVLRFSNIARLGEFRIDFVIEVEEGAYLPNDPQWNVVRAGGIVSVNLATKPVAQGSNNSANLRLTLASSCCSRPSCSECWDPAMMTDPTDRNTHSNFNCRPFHPLTGKRNYFCCCYGIDDFPMDYAGLEDQITKDSSGRSALICAVDDVLPAMHTPRTDTAAALRYRYREARPSIDTSDPNDWYTCSSKHVRALNRFGNEVATGYEKQPFLDSFFDGGYLLTDAVGTYFNVRIFDFDKGNRGDFTEEMVVFSEGANLLYWQYPQERAACGGDMMTTNQEIMVIATDAAGTEMVATSATCKAISESVRQLVFPASGINLNSPYSSPWNLEGDDSGCTPGVPATPECSGTAGAQATGYPRPDYFSLALCANPEVYDAFETSCAAGSGDSALSCDIGLFFDNTTVFGMKFDALDKGGNENNPTSFDFDTKQEGQYCNAVLRAVDVFYTLRFGYVRAILQAGYTGDGSNPQGRNLLFSGDSAAQPCVSYDENATLCLYQEDCVDGYFCATNCINGRCLLPPGWRMQLGAIYSSGGYGVCQSCSDCVYDNEVYSDPTQVYGTATCNDACAGYNPPTSDPGFTVAAFHKCSTSDDCEGTVDGSKLFCADSCLSASSETTATYGMANGCSETGSGPGYCQKCDPQCVNDVNILPTGSVCEDICDNECPACFLINEGYTLKAPPEV